MCSCIGVITDVCNRYGFAIGSNSDLPTAVQEADFADKEQLAICLASISEMALTGVDCGLLPLPPPRAADQAAAASTVAAGDRQPSKQDDRPSPKVDIRALKRKLRLKLQRHRSMSGGAGNDQEVLDHVSKHIQLLDSLESQVGRVDLPQDVFYLVDRGSVYLL